MSFIFGTEKQHDKVAGVYFCFQLSIFSKVLKYNLKKNTTPYIDYSSQLRCP